MTQETELLPCPFCGNEPEYRQQPNHSIACVYSLCPAKYCVCKGDTKEEVIAAWNTRASLGKGEAKPVEAGELAAIISDAVHDNPFAILSEKSPLTAEQERKRASAILSRYNVTKKEEV